MDLTWLRIKLTQWGRANRVTGIGYPTMSATEKARIGRGGVFNGPSLPPDLEEIDIHVSRAPPEHKRVLVEIYTKTGHWTEHAIRLDCSSKDSYFRAKKSAEVYLNTSLSVRMT